MRWLISLVLLIAACGEQPRTHGTRTVPGDAGSSRCLDVALPEGGLATALPARVSMMFTVDTCDGRPLSGLTGDAFEILEDGHAISEHESQMTIRARGQRYRMDSLVLLDLSGSILRGGGFPALQEAATLYIDAVLATPGSGHRIALHAFDGRTSTTPISEFTDDPLQLKAALDKLNERQCTSGQDCAGFADRKSCAGWLCVDDSTNLHGAISQGVDRLERELELAQDVAFKEGALIVFTDGTDQAARVTRESALERVRDSTLHLFTIGLGSEIDEAALRAFGKDGFHPAAEASVLGDAFRQIADDIVALANRFYFLEYCSPKRSGRHELTLSTRWDVDGMVLDGSASDTFDATGFESGCELPQE